MEDPRKTIAEVTGVTGLAQEREQAPLPMTCWRARQPHSQILPSAVRRPTKPLRGALAVQGPKGRAEVGAVAGSKQAKESQQSWDHRELSVANSLSLARIRTRPR